MRRLVALFVLALATPLAQAELWGYIDEQGRSHFSNHRVDERYQLFFKGPTNLDAPVARPDPSQESFSGAAAVILERVSGHPNVARFARLIETSAKQQGLDPALVKAVIAVESAYEPTAVSAKGAIGLMQVIPATAERYGIASDARRSVVQKLMDPATNLRIGTRYLAELIGRFENDLTLALAAYNAGEGAVERYARRVPPYPETQAYVVLVQQFHALYAPRPPPPKPARVVVPKPGSR